MKALHPSEKTGIRQKDWNPLEKIGIWRKRLESAGKDQDPLEKAIQDLFRKEFLDLSQRLRNLKWRNYKHLAHHLKMIEAKVMIDTVATQFASQFPDACLISIHDAFHTTEEHLDVLKVMIETAFEAECGIVPKVKTKMISRERMSESLAAA